MTVTSLPCLTASVYGSSSSMRDGCRNVNLRQSVSLALATIENSCPSIVGGRTSSLLCWTINLSLPFTSPFLMANFVLRVASLRKGFCMADLRIRTVFLTAAIEGDTIVVLLFVSALSLTSSSFSWVASLMVYFCLSPTIKVLHYLLIRGDQQYFSRRDNDATSHISN